MARTPGASVLMDVRTTALLQDHSIKTNPCVPGAEKMVTDTQEALDLNSVKPMNGQIIISAETTEWRTPS